MKKEVMLWKRVFGEFRGRKEEGEMIYHNLKNKRKKLEKQEKIIQDLHVPVQCQRKRKCSKKGGNKTWLNSLFCLLQLWERHSSISNRKYLQPALHNPPIYPVISICYTHRNSFFSFLSSSQHSSITGGQPWSVL